MVPELKLDGWPGCFDVLSPAVFGPHEIEHVVSMRRPDTADKRWVMVCELNDGWYGLMVAWSNLEDRPHLAETPDDGWTKVRPDLQAIVALTRTHSCSGLLDLDWIEELETE